MSQTSLYYEVAGQGPPAILVHGGGVDSRMWDDQFAIFAESFRTIRYDAAGFGRSPLPDGPINARGDLAAVLDAVGVARAHVVGLSMGAAIAIEFALAYPHRVRSLIVTMGGLPGYSEEGWPDELARGFEAINASVRAGDLDRASEQMLDLSPMRPAASIPRLRQRLEEIIRDQPWIPDGSLSFDELTPPAGERIGELSMPLLVVQGDREIEEFREMGRWVAREAPRARLTELTGAGHMVNMERPAEYNRVVLDFLRGVEQADAVGAAS